MFTIAKTFEFSAGHILDHLPEGHQCNSYHGHNYELTVHLTSPTITEGMIVDYNLLSFIKKYIDEKIDHHFLIGYSQVSHISDEMTREECLAIVNGNKRYYLLFEKAKYELPLNGSIDLYFYADVSTAESMCKYFSELFSAMLYNEMPHIHKQLTSFGVSIKETRKTHASYTLNFPLNNPNIFSAENAKIQLL